MPDAEVAHHDDRPRVLVVDDEKFIRDILADFLGMEGYVVRTAEDGQRIDASGSLPDGSKFEGVAGLQQALLGKPDLFAGAFAEKLLTYALGRGVEYYDAPAVRKITADSRTKDYRFSSFILGIVASTPFQQRRSQ